MAERAPRREAESLPTGWEKDLTEQFRLKLSTQRMNRLSSQRSSSSASRRSTPNPERTSSYRRNLPLPSRYGTTNRMADSPAGLEDFALGSAPLMTPPLRNIPLIPTPPSAYDNPSLQFRNKLILLSETPRKWENPGLLDEAMKSVPLERIYNEASEESQLRQAKAESIGKKPAWSYQDCVIRALMKWFKAEFFSWVNNPPCSRCGSPTFAVGNAAPTPDERAMGGNTVELYQCSLPDCSLHERFPRYNDAFVLMSTRKGRLGEWVNCFGMLCRAMGSRVRWVWNSEDHVWVEVYSDYRKMWVHVDPCEGAFNNPLLYSEGPGWNKRLAYCIAFSNDGAMDVTYRYCRNPVKYGKARNKCPEAVLLYIVDEIRAMRRRDLDKKVKFDLEGEDARESRELRHYYISTLFSEIVNIKPPPPGRQVSSAEEADAQKAAEAREVQQQVQNRTSNNSEFIIPRPEVGRRRSPDGDHRSQ